MTITILVISVLIFGCNAKPTSTPSPVPSPTPAPTTEKTIELKFANLWAPDGSLNPTVIVPFCKELEKKTNGRLKITQYWAGALGKSNEVFLNVASGSADLTCLPGGNNPGRLNLSIALGLPGLCQTLEERMLAPYQFSKTGALDADYSDVKLVYLLVTPSPALVTKKEIRSLNDIKGLRLWSVGGLAAETIKVFGGIPVSLPSAELFMALDRGMVNGMLGSWSSIQTLKGDELTQYAVGAVPGPASIVVMVMSQKAWDQCPKDIQKIINETAEAYLGNSLINHYKEKDVKVMDDFAAASGKKVYTLSADEWKEWSDVVMPVAEDWLKQTESQGFGVRKTVKEFGSFLQQFRKK